MLPSRQASSTTLPTPARRSVSFTRQNLAPLTPTSASSTNVHKASLAASFPALHFLVNKHQEWESTLHLLKSTRQILNNREIYRKEKWKRAITEMFSTYRDWWATVKANRLLQQSPTLRALTRHLREFMVIAAEEPACNVRVDFVTERQKKEARKRQTKVRKRSKPFRPSAIPLMGMSSSMTSLSESESVLGLNDRYPHRTSSGRRTEPNIFATRASETDLVSNLLNEQSPQLSSQEVEAIYWKFFCDEHFGEKEIEEHVRPSTQQAQPRAQPYFKRALPTPGGRHTSVVAYKVSRAAAPVSGVQKMIFFQRLLDTEQKQQQGKGAEGGGRFVSWDLIDPSLLAKLSSKLMLRKYKELRTDALKSRRYKFRSLQEKATVLVRRQKVVFRPRTLLLRFQ